jgi:hypothetical protein
MDILPAYSQILMDLKDAWIKTDANLGKLLSLCMYPGIK